MEIKRLAINKLGILVVLFPVLTFYLVGCGTNQAAVLSSLEKRTNERTSQLAERQYQSINIGFQPRLAEGNKVKTTKKKVIPAVVFWMWDKQFECELDGKYNETLIKNRFYKAADSLNLASKINGKSLDVVVEKAPGKFLFSDSGGGVFLLFGAGFSNHQAVLPDTTHLIASYNIVADGAIIKQGVVDVPKTVTPPNQRLKQSGFQFLLQYLNDYETRIKEMTYEALSRILKETQG